MPCRQLTVAEYKYLSENGDLQDLKSYKTEALCKDTCQNIIDFFGKCEQGWPVCEKQYRPEEWAQGRRGFADMDACYWGVRQNSGYLIECGQIMCYFCDGNSGYLPPDECAARGGYASMEEMQRRCGTGNLCRGATCGGPDEESPDNSWGFFCQHDVQGCTWTWDGGAWNLTSNCENRCSCCVCVPWSEVEGSMSYTDQGGPLSSPAVGDTRSYPYCNTLIS